jgi:hypothetical protein
VSPPAFNAKIPPGSGVRFAATYSSWRDPLSPDPEPHAGRRFEHRRAQAFAGALDPANGWLILGGGVSTSSAGTLGGVTGATVTGETLMVRAVLARMDGV